MMGIEAHHAFGQKSKSNLSAMVFNREVTADCYRRQVCKRVDANLEQVKGGWLGGIAPMRGRYSSTPR